jgi:ariadne-1
MFYFERFINHDKAEKQAISLRPVISAKIELLQKLKNFPIGELTFLQDACDEVIRTRQVLKWTYAYGFYCINANNKQKKERFEFWQTDLEKFCEELHKMVEKPLDVYLDPNILDRSPFY